MIIPPLRSARIAALVAIAACSSATPSGAPTPAARGRYVVVPPSEPREQTADQQVRHVLDRLAFGPRPGDVARVREMGVDQWIALQLAPDRIDDAATESLVASAFPSYHLPTSELAASALAGQQAIRQRARQLAAQGDSSAKRDVRTEVLRGDPMLREQLQRARRSVTDVQGVKLARAVASERQLEEVMTDFWENHFSVFSGKGQTRIFLVDYDRDVIRPRALGKFRDLLGAVAKSPAMLFYLDQFQSTVDSMHTPLDGGGAFARRGRLQRARPMVRPGQKARPAQRARGLNENYARELLELHTLGVDGGYTQHDVIEVARALTGWTMNPRQGGEFNFRPQIHDADEKIVLGHRLAAGRGIEDGEEVLDILARSPATARFIARKLAVRFVSDDPPPALVDRAAQTFLSTDGDIRETVRTIVTSPEFFSRAAYRSKVKSPFELVASALRAFGAPADTTPRSAQAVAFLGAPIFGHQAPNGWPETGDAWMNAGAILNRINFGLALAGGRLPGASLAQWPEAEHLRGASREQQVDAVIGAMLGGHVSPDTRNILLNGENPLAAKFAGSVDSAAVNAAAMADAAEESAMRPMTRRQPGAAFARPVPLAGLAQIVGLAIGAPEFQRR
ncbi:MAG TPA: DUF1800 domain-containing protein [Kofleriaceae bacterium]|nr:DUF1800 domain-containing protein [Kofleriaceae bacterium]